MGQAGVRRGVIGRMTSERRDRAAGLLAGALLVALLSLGGCSAGTAQEPGGQAGGPTSAAPTTAHPTTAAPTTGHPTTTAATTTTSPPATRAAPPTTAKPPPKPVQPAKLGPGSSGPAVAALQRRLAQLHYDVHAFDGQWGSETTHAVVSFQKVNRLGRDGIAGRRTQAALAHPRVPRPRSTAGGFHVEADLSLQVVYLVDGGRITRILDASSASGETYVSQGDTRVAVTPLGDFRVERKINAWHRSPLGLLYRPAFFHGGYALHGALSVPPFPASHGCIRITTAAMDRLYDRLALGTEVLVYRS